MKTKLVVYLSHLALYLFSKHLGKTNGHESLKVVLYYYAIVLELVLSSKKSIT